MGGVKRMESRMKDKRVRGRREGGREGRMEKSSTGGGGEERRCFQTNQKQRQYRKHIGFKSFISPNQTMTDGQSQLP